MQETWTAMEELVDEGLAKNIGLRYRKNTFCVYSTAKLWRSNCQGSIILDVLRYARIEPQVLQIELHPYLTQEGLVKLAKTLGIAVTGYSSLGPQSYVELGADKGAENLMDHSTILSIAHKHQKSTWPLFP